MCERVRVRVGVGVCKQACMYVHTYTRRFYPLESASHGRAPPGLPAGIGDAGICMHVCVCMYQYPVYVCVCVRMYVCMCVCTHLD